MKKISFGSLLATLVFIKNSLRDTYVMELTISIENMVASTKLAEEFDLPKIEAKLKDAEYDKRKFPGLVYRIKDPRATFLIFTTGKIVCTGTKNVWMFTWLSPTWRRSSSLSVTRRSI